MATFLGFLWGVHTENGAFGSQAETFEKAQKTSNDRNFKDALELYEQGFSEPLAADCPEGTIRNAVFNMVQCMNRLNRSSELDAQLDKILSLNGKNFNVLVSVASVFLSYQTDSYGYWVDNRFRRGNNRAGGSYLSCEERDRQFGLYLMNEAYKLVENGDVSLTPEAQIGFFCDFAREFQQNRYSYSAWQLQVLTNLSVKPEFPTPDSGNPNNQFGRRFGRFSGFSGSSLAPVDENNNPIVYSVPEQFETAKSDGERWRFLLDKAEQISQEYRKNQPSGVSGDLAYRPYNMRADFAINQFGVQTLENWTPRVVDESAEETNQAAKAGIFTLESLSDGETIAKLATGVRRFELPEGYSYIQIWKALLADAVMRNDYGCTISFNDKLANEYMNRRQFVKAAEHLKAIVDRVGKEIGTQAQSYLDAQARYKQVVGNWGRFDGAVQQNGLKIAFPFVFRNAKEVQFTAYEIKIESLLEDVKSYLRGNRGQLEYDLMNTDNIGYRIIEKNQIKYRGKQVDQWVEMLAPLPGHQDREFFVNRSVPKPGAYLLEADVKGGNSMFAVVWVADMVLAQKKIEGKYWYFTADAQTGDAIPNAAIEFFGFKQEQKRDGREFKFNVETNEFMETTDENGQVQIDEKKFPNSFQWLVSATGLQKQFAYMGFSNFWYPNRYIFGNDWPQKTLKAYSITNCPVYKPGTEVQYKCWLRTASYEGDDNEFAGQKAKVTIMDPQGEKVQEQEIQFDQYAGYEGKLTLNQAAKLGAYQIQLLFVRPSTGQVQTMGVGSFRVEEYKKPEFSVKIDAPTEPVALGDAFKAKLQAKYYFGQPVTQATVKIKVVRNEYQKDWFPAAPWDWLYGAGYWWRTFDYLDYPGWSRWGCVCPKPAWYWNRFPNNPPEVILETEAQLDKNGCYEIGIDSSVAKAMFGNANQKYEITAEVTDQSRRTITGSGTVLVAAVPFEIYSWLSQGVYQSGDTLKATFQSRTLAGKPVQGKGLFKLYRVTYKEDGSEDRNKDLSTDSEFVNTISSGESLGNTGLLKPIETEVYRQEMDPDEDGKTIVQLTVRQPGQYRTEYSLDNGRQAVQVGGSLFTVRGQGFDSTDCRFSALELIPDKETYQPGETVRLTINVDQLDAVVWLFPRAVNGLCAAPQRVQMTGKTGFAELNVEKRDMPNFFVEAVTVGQYQVVSQSQQICVPPEKRILSMNILPSNKTYKPGEKATVQIELKDWNGKPFVGQTVVAVYDKSLEYIASQMDSGDIAPFFWNWKRSHQPQTTDSFKKWMEQVLEPGASPMDTLGMFGGVEYSFNRQSDMSDRFGGLSESSSIRGRANRGFGGAGGGRGMALKKMAAPMAAAPMMAEKSMALDAQASDLKRETMDADFGADKEVLFEQSRMDKPGAPAPTGGLVDAQVRTKFADSALWIGALETDENGQAEIELTMPENLTTWVVKAWAMGQQTEVGQAQTEVITQKNLILRAQTPRFMVQKDRIVLTANVHNYLSETKQVQIRLELVQNEAGKNEAGKNGAEKNESGKPVLELANGAAPSELIKTVTIPANGETRVDWEVESKEAGQATVRMYALTNEESDAMEVQFPVVLYGFLKQDSFSGMISANSSPTEKTPAAEAEKTPAADTAVIPFEFRIPEASQTEQNRLEVRFSPTLAGAMLDAIPYLVDYPYGCTEQTLNRFLPAAIARKTVQQMGVDLAELEKTRTNLNAQEIGDAKRRSEQWKKTDANPVFDQKKMDEIVNDGLDALFSMRCSDGGWGWFSGYGERSFAHTTAVVEHGLLIARNTDLNVQDKDLLPGIQWLANYQKEQIRLLENAKKDPKPQGWEWKAAADNTDALVFRVLAEAAKTLPDSKAIDADLPMAAFLMRDKAGLSPYGLALAGLGLNDLGMNEQRDQALKNLSQYLNVDDENQTAWLDMGDACYWYWYGSEIETQAAYLKLLCATGETKTATRLVKYLLNNRKHASYWNSTRDTALVLESFADYLRVSGEMNPEMTVEVVLDDQTIKTVQINKENLFSFDGTAVLTGSELKPGDHKLELRRTGRGPLYSNAYVTYFTMEDEMEPAGLEIRVERKYYKLVRDKSGKADAVGSRGQAVEVKTDVKKRIPLKDGDTVQSGDIILVDLTLESKNDYEYLLFEDRKPAGFEPLEVRSGYNGNELGAYVEFRDQKVSFFVRQLRRGRCSISYQLRAEAPGTVCALPASGEAMYAPELKGSSRQFRISTEDAKP